MIVLGPERYALSIAPAGPDDNTTGDLNATGAAPLTIRGSGPGVTVIDAGGLGDRALSVASDATVTLRRLRVTGGHPPGAQPGLAGGVGGSCTAGGAGTPGSDAGDAGSGGGIFNSGTLVLDTVAVVGNRAAAGGTGGAGGTQSGTGGCSGANGGQGGSGGGVYNRSRLTVADSTVRGNTAGPGGAGGGGGSDSLGSGGPGGAGGAGGNGGGIYNQGSLSVIASTIYGNRGGVGGVGGQGGAGTARGVDGGGGPGAAGGGIFSTGGRLTVSNSTLAGNFAGAGGAGGGLTGSGATGGNGGGVAVTTGPSVLRNVTVADNAVGGGGGGAGGSTPVRPAASGLGGGLFVQSSTPADDMRLQNTIVASNVGSGCAGTTASAIADRGHDLRWGDRTCPGRTANPKLGPLQDNGGATWTMALRAGSAAVNRVPPRSAGCPSTDQRGVRRPEGRACDIGAYEFAVPTITVASPLRAAFYLRGSRILARYRCDEGGIASAIATCKGSVRLGRAIGTHREGTGRFVVTAVDKAGSRVRTTVRYDVFEYVNPLREVGGLTPRRIDLGVDYAGSGPLLALGNGVVTMATDSDSGPPSCWAVSCWPGGGIVVYRLSDGPFAGKYAYVAEHITVTVRAGQRVMAGEQIATLYPGYPWSEFGWAAGPGPEALGMADGHRCTCSDPGGWSTIDGRDFDHLLVMLGAPSGWLQSTPNQSMPRGWPSWSG